MYRSVRLESVEKFFEKSALLFRPTNAAIKRNPNKYFSRARQNNEISAKRFDEPKFKGNQKPSGNGSFHFVFATAENHDEILAFFMKTVVVDEPLIQSSCMRHVSADMKEFLLAGLSDNISVMAMSSSGKLLGVMLNANFTPTGLTANKLRGGKKIRCKTTLDIMNLWMKMEREVNHFQRWPVSHIFELRVLATAAEARGMGIARALIDRSRQLAEQLRYPMMRADCTGIYSAQACERLGFTCVHEIKYKDYKDANGQIVFPVKPPHDKLKFFIRELD